MDKMAEVDAVVSQPKFIGNYNNARVLWSKYKRLNKEDRGNHEIFKIQKVVTLG